MSKQLVAVFVGLAVVTVALMAILVSTRKNRVELTGEVLKVRSHQIDPEHTLFLIDFRVSNPSTQQFVVREVEVFIDEPDGKSTPGELFPEIDARRVIDYYKAIGTKYTPGLLRKDKINPGQSLDRSIALSAPMTDDRLQKRKGLRLVVHDIDGAKTEFAESVPAEKR